MWYITSVEEYPIYEPAEGGYYYTGTQIVEERQFNTWRKARQFYNKVRKEFIAEFGEPMTDEEREDYWRYKDRVYEVNQQYGTFNRGIYHSTQYVGEGHRLTLTSKPVEERGWVPYE